MNGERLQARSKIRLMGMIVITELIKSQCKKSWTAHGWVICQGCNRAFGRHGAIFSLTGAPAPHLLIDMDKIPCIGQQKHCDYIFIADDLKAGVNWIIPVELASGRGKEIGYAVEQLQTGAMLAEKTMENISSLKILPVLVGKIKRIRKTRKHAQGMVRFHGKKVPVSVVTDGSLFANALKSKISGSQGKG